MTGMSAEMFGRLLADSAERNRVDEGVKALVGQYYDDYTDSVEYDPPYLAALELLTNHGQYCNTSLDELINEVEADLRANGRPDVRTPGLSVSDDEEDE